MRAKWVVRGLGMVVTLLCVLAMARFVWPQPGPGEQPGCTYRQLAFLRSALDDGADHEAQELFPEGYVFMNALYGLSWLQAGERDMARRPQALRESRWALRRLESASGTAVFDPRMRPAYGVYWAGWSNWLRGRVIALGGGDDELVRRFEAATAELADAFTASATPFLAAYPGQAWPVDSTVAIASLRLHDRLRVPRFGAVVDRWLAAARDRLDPATGLLPHEVSATDGSVLEGARATSQTLIHRFLPEIDAEFARTQYAAFRRQFLAYPGGFGPALREFPHGRDGAGDVDSGPLVAGISLSATVVGMGAARANGDRELATALGATGELLGLPVTVPGSKRYAFGLMPIGDAFVVWSATARPVVQPAADFAIRWWWRLPWLLLVTVVALAPWIPLLCRRIRARTAKAFRAG
ncbi:hypothetical protein ACFVMC_26065 [Nocardia sp. NPDC127579]|uniref:hypothetical protein n=1 Tax=Nocardia sp. NPDC127579 TaxID=3345402 RepID=UPI00363E463A